MSWTWKPVPWMIASTSISRPSVVITPRLGHPLDPLGLDLDVVPLQRGVVVVGDQDPLAAHDVVGRHLAAQLGVGDLPADVKSGEPLGEA